MSIAIPKDHLAIIKKLLHTIVPKKPVIAFGSRVTGTASDTSDLDLCIVGKEALTSEKLAELRDALSAAKLPYKIDVIDWPTADATLKQTIKTKYEVIQDNEKLQSRLKEI